MYNIVKIELWKFTQSSGKFIYRRLSHIYGPSYASEYIIYVTCNRVQELYYTFILALSVFSLLLT